MRKMEQKNVMLALAIIARAQERTSPVSLKVGYTDATNQIQFAEIVLLEAAPMVIDELLHAGFKLYMNEEAGGLVLEDYAVKGAK